MDRMIYTALSGAKQVLERQATTTHNLANATTAGFRAQVDAFKAVPVVGEGLPTRAFVVSATTGADFTPGAIQQTGRDLDVAIQGKGWLVVQGDDGAEAYTRHGSLKMNENGLLTTQGGALVQGGSGPISIPPDTKVAIAKDGTVSTLPTFGKSEVNILGKIKLVNPEENALERRDDGLFRMRDGSTPEEDPSVSLLAGALEGSNVNVVESMVSMISLARQFDLQMKVLQDAEANEQKATQLLSLI